MYNIKVERNSKTSYQVYNEKYKLKEKFNLLDDFFPPLPEKTYQIIYADPPWHYNGKLQFDRSGKSEFNKEWEKEIFISGANLKYPTVKTKELEKLDINRIAHEDSLLFLWTTNPHLEQAINLGNSWGFEYKTVGFVWDKQVHNPGQYTLSYCEMCLIFKKGRIPKPRGARNIKQLISEKRSEHSVKPDIVRKNIEQMFPKQKKIELFARSTYKNWDSWGLEAVYKNRFVTSQEDALNENQSDQLTF